MKEMTVSTVRTTVKPKYGATASALLTAMRAFYEDAENERAFQEWKAEREKKGA